MTGRKIFQIVCIAALVSSPALSASEKMSLAPVFFGKGNIAFLSTGTVAGGFHSKTAWTVWVNSPPAMVDNYRARVEVMQMAFDCAKKAFQIRFVRLFDDNANVLVAIPFGADAPFAPTVPKSGEAQMEASVCGAPPRGYKPLHSIPDAVAVTKALFKDQPQK
jgi:hypothetical protein